MRVVSASMMFVCVPYKSPGGHFGRWHQQMTCGRATNSRCTPVSRIYTPSTITTSQSFYNCPFLFLFLFFTSPSKTVFSAEKKVSPINLLL